MFPKHCIVVLQYKPFMGRRADVRLWRVLVSHFKYKPFMRCRSDVRLRHALSLFSVISPLCGVAPTPDCGIIILAASSRGVIQTLVWHPVFTFGFREDYRPTSLLFSHALLSLCLNALVIPSLRFMFTFVISYVRTVLRVLS